MVLEIVSLEQVLQSKFVEIYSARVCSQPWILNKRNFFLEAPFLGCTPQTMAGTWISLSAQYFLLVVSRKLSYNWLTSVKWLTSLTHRSGRYSYPLSDLSSVLKDKHPKCMCSPLDDCYSVITQPPVHVVSTNGNVHHVSVCSRD